MESEQTELEQTNKSMADLPPEYCHYRDEGCEITSSCLNCPLPKCVYDEPGGKQHWLKRRRNQQIARLFNAEGKGVKELALMFGLSKRTVQRALKEGLMPLLDTPSVESLIERAGNE